MEKITELTGEDSEDSMIKQGANLDKGSQGIELISILSSIRLSHLIFNLYIYYSSQQSLGWNPGMFFGWEEILEN